MKALVKHAEAISARAAAHCSLGFHLLSAANRKCSGSSATSILKGIHVGGGDGEKG